VISSERERAGVGSVGAGDILFKTPNKKELFPTIKEFLNNSIFKIIHI